MVSNEDRIRELAYQLWEADGKPEGKATTYWQHAVEIVEKAIKTGQQSPEEID